MVLYEVSSNALSTALLGVKNKTARDKEPVVKSLQKLIGSLAGGAGDRLESTGVSRIENEDGGDGRASFENHDHSQLFSYLHV